MYSVVEGGIRDVDGPFSDMNQTENNGTNRKRLFEEDHDGQREGPATKVGRLVQDYGHMNNIP